MPAWNFANIWEIAADNLPDAEALAHGSRRILWKDFDKRADGIARTLLERGAMQQDKVAQYLYNSPEYMESMFACFKAGLVPVNTNYRYADDELVYLWDNADAVAVVFHGSFVERIEGIKDSLPKVQTWLWVDDESGECPAWAIPYEQAAATETDRVIPPWGRGDDDLLFMYTGGTTGMPKGVMWRQESLIRAVVAATNAFFHEPATEENYAQLRKDLVMPGVRQLPGCPQMHGTGQFTCFITLSSGGCVVTLDNRSFDVEEMLDVVEAEKIGMLVIVGDAFGKPMVKALDANPGRWDLTSLWLITSSGVMWSQETKDALLKHNGGMMLIDAFSSSEAIGLGQSVSSAGGSSGTAKFVLGDNSRVITDEGIDVVPGSGEIGRVAVRGHTPVGYYKDPEKSASTFVLIDGDTYSIPGDYAQVEADGALTLLGRGSVCINTGGEKVFPEEVEEVLKLHPAVLDSVVVGLPDDKFGQAITGVVELRDTETAEANDLIAHVKGKLASFKAPKSVVFIDTIGRAANGKVDYKRMTRYAADELGVDLPS